jgi:hypothetical protein
LTANENPEVSAAIMVFDDSVEGRVRDLVVASGLIRLCITVGSIPLDKSQWPLIAMTALTKGTSCRGM